MNLIERLGGYEKTKDHRDYLIDFGNEFNRPNKYEVNKINNALIEYRRQHNIFEVGDKVVSKENNEFVYTVITVDGGLGRLKNILFDHVYQLHNFRHATDEEIKAGKRLEVK